MAKALATRILPEALNGGIVRGEFLIGARQTASQSIAALLRRSNPTRGRFTSHAKRTHPLASTARWMGDFFLTRLRKRLNLVPLEALDLRAPGRSLVGNIPDTVAQVGIDSNGYPKVEIYPPPSKSEIIHYIYWALPTALTMSSTIPSVIEAYVLKEGVLIDVFLCSNIIVSISASSSSDNLNPSLRKTLMPLSKKGL